MSLRRFNHIAMRVAQEIVARLLPKRLTTHLPGVVQRAVGVTLRGPQRIVISRSPIMRMIQRGIRANTRHFLRPFAALPHGRLKRLQDEHSRRHSLYRTTDFTASARALGVAEKIRGLFSTNARYNQHLVSVEMPATLDGYEIGAHIACGCNAAVYELRVKDPNHNDSAVGGAAPPSQFYNSMESFPLALKIMFNYQFDMPERCLWMEMGPELIPLRGDKMPKEALRAGRMANFRPPVNTHPNLIKLHTAFVDRMPVLPGAADLYPEALPPASDDFDRISVLGHTLMGEPSTLFIVMKRYRMTLRDYVLTRPRNYWIGRVLYGQLLEAIVFLQENGISHRDMKSDNVLLDFNDDDEVPHLVLSDFGSALVGGDFVQPHFDDTADLGGNLSLRAPEVRRSRPGPDTYVDFAQADLWSAATLGYEIFTRTNPFYTQLSSELYEEHELPLLPKRLHYAVKEVTYEALRVDPAQRPPPQVAANVVAISLFRFGQDVRQFLESCGLRTPSWAALKELRHLRNSWSSTLKSLGSSIEKKLDGVTQLYAAETIISKLLVPAVISRAELQLRATFLARLRRDEVWQAMAYFYDDDSYANQHRGCSSSAASTSSTAPLDTGPHMKAPPPNVVPLVA